MMEGRGDPAVAKKSHLSSWREGFSQLENSTQEGHQQLTNQVEQLLQFLNVTMDKVTQSNEEGLHHLADLVEQKIQEVEMKMMQIEAKMTSSLNQTKEEILSEVSALLSKSWNENEESYTKKNDSSLKEAHINEMISSLNQTKEEILSEVSSLLAPILSQTQCQITLGSACNPAVSCQHIKNNLGVSNPPSGDYYIRNSTGSIVRVYCDMTRSCGGVSGGWMKVISFDMDNPSHSCPSGLQFFTNVKRRCGIGSDSAGCASTVFGVHGVPYQKVCGKVIGYQKATTDAFLNFNLHSIEGAYIDGASLTHGRNPRHHIWTFANALDEIYRQEARPYVCPCTYREGSTSPIPSFVGNDYFCDTGSKSYVGFNVFYGDDPLWDGAGCGGSSTCCSFNNPPWFMKQLSSSTSDDLELRVCRDQERSDEDVSIKSVELYVQ